MNREIKFRGKGIEDNKWHYGNLIIDEGRYYICLQVNDHIKRDDYEVYMIEVIPETVGQYTGLKDKNRKEIYEGDIVVIEVFNYQEPEWSGEFRVTYSEDLASYTFDDLEDISNFKTMNTIKDYYHYEIEIIGNIYENKDLLKD